MDGTGLDQTTQLQSELALNFLHVSEVPFYSALIVHVQNKNVPMQA